MNEIEKLKRLLHHWIEHNQEHSRTYREWAERIKDLNPDASLLLEDIARETERIDELLKKLIKDIEGTISTI